MWPKSIYRTDRKTHVHDHDGRRNDGGVSDRPFEVCREILLQHQPDRTMVGF
jgi:hypothetical protein